MKKILVLGCSSFGGSAFVNFMLDKNFFVIGTYRRKKNILYQPHLKNKNKVNFIDYKIDFDKDLFAIIEIVKKYKPEYIIDFASICMVNESWNNPDVYIKSNLEVKSLFLRHIHKYSFIKISRSTYLKAFPFIYTDFMSNLILPNRSIEIFS